MACSLFGISDNLAMYMVGVGFIIGVIQDAVETAVNSSGGVLLSATALGLVFSFNANAATAVNVLTGINFNQGTSDATLTPEQTDITGMVIR